MRRVDANEQAIRDLYAARARRDWDTVRTLLADEVGYHEPGDEDHSGDYQGRDDVVALLEKLVAVTEGTFQLEPEAFLNLQQHSAVLVRWCAEREGRRSDGYEIAVYRVSDGKIAEVWFYNEPSDAESFKAVFAYD
jgi:ketosteroid isomerase-like protein